MGLTLVETLAAGASEGLNFPECPHPVCPDPPIASCKPFLTYAQWQVDIKPGFMLCSVISLKQ